jgi:hypothetical protein
MNQTLMQAIAAIICNLAIAANQAFNNCFAGLFTNTPTINPGINQTTLQEANFQGYSRVQITNWGQTLTLSDGGACVVGPRCQFVANAAMNLPQVITGGFLNNASLNGNLIAAGLFDTPIPVNNPGDSVNWNPGQGFDLPTNYANLPGPNP